MNWKLSASAFVGALFVCANAIAATDTTTVPTLSGKYAYMHNTFCQPTVLVNYQNGTPFLINLNASGPSGGWGDIRYEVGVATFNTTKMTLTAAGTNVEGTPMLLQSVGGGPNNLEGTAIASSPSTGKVTYSTTATTVTFQGQVYNAAYGVVGTTGIASHVSLVALNSKGCADEFTFDRQ